MAGKRVTVSDSWEVTIPEGFIYCTDKKIIGSHRNIIIMEDKSENEFDESFAATISFTSQEQDTKGQGIFVGHQMFNMFSSGDETVVRDNGRMFIAYSYLGKDKEDGSTLDKFLLYVATRSKLSSIQVFFNDSKLSLAKQTDLVDKVARSIEPVIKKGYKEKNGLEVLSFSKGKEVTIDNRYIIPIPDGFHYSTNPAVIGDQLKLVVFPEKYGLSNDPIEAPYGLYLFPMEFNTGDNFKVEWCDAVNRMLTEQVAIFQNNIAIDKLEARKGLGIFTQAYYGDPDTSWNKIYAAIFAKNKLNAISVIYNHPGIDGSKEVVSEFFWNVTYDWLERIRLKGEKKKESNVKETSDSELGKAVPDKSLYPHYGHILDTANMGTGLGATVIVNASGTEYQLCSFDDLLKDMNENDGYDDEDKVNPEAKKLVEKCINNNPAGYVLDKTAEEMIGLFHVNESIFDMRHDREAELQEGYIRKAYMMNALRSFAWTLADYCKENKITPKKIEKTLPSEIAKYVESRKWLNYDGETHCKGLCANSDLHVYYIPDSIPKTESKIFLPSEKELDDYKKMKEQFPGYSPIFAQVGSLDKLRKDLDYIYPAIQILFDELAATRDTSKPLDGAEADIVYAWIALAKAAKLPFYTEDGPSGYLLSQPTTDKEFSDKYGIAKKGDAKRNKTEKKEDKIEKAPKKSNQNSETKKPTTAENKIDPKLTARMYAILTDEEKTGYKNKADEFYSSYKEFFPKMVKKDFTDLKNMVKERIETEGDIEEYKELFMRESLKDRFEITASKYFHNCYQKDFRDQREETILATKDWFRPEEQKDMVKLLDEKLAEIKKDLKEQINAGGDDWMSFYSAKKYLEVKLMDSPFGEEIPEVNGLFQRRRPGYKGTVNMTVKGTFGYTAELANFIPWIWNVSFTDIWDAALHNDVDDQRVNSRGWTSNSNVDARKIYDEVKEKYEFFANNSKSFVDKINGFYNNTDPTLKIKQKDIDKIIKEYFDSEKNYQQCRWHVVKEANKLGRVALKEAVENADLLRNLKATLPTVLADDILKVKTEKALNKAKNDLIEAQLTVSRSEKSIKEYEESIEKDLKILDEKKKKLADYEEAKGRELEEDKFRITTNQESQKAVIHKLEAKIAELEKSIEETQSELENTSFFKFSLKKELTAKVEELSEQLNEEKGKLPEANSKLFALNAEFNNKVLKHQQEIDRMKKSISDCSDRIKSSNSRIDHLKKLIEDKNSIIPGLENKVKELEGSK